MSNTTDDIIESIKLRSFAPISQDTYDTEKLLILMTEELRSYVVPQIISVREDFFLCTEDEDVAANRKYYPIVERSIGNSFKALVYVDASEGESPIVRAKVEDIPYYDGSGQPSRFVLMGDQIRVMPAPSTAIGKIRQYFFRAQSQLVETISCAKITEISKLSSTTEFTVDTDLTGSISVGDKVDFQNAQSPFLLWAYDVEVVAITANKITVNNSEVEDASGTIRAEKNDYITPRFKTNIPQVPVEYHSLLAQKVTCKILEGLGDRRKYEVAKMELKEMEKDLFGIIKSRVESQPQKITNMGTLAAIDRGLK